MIGEKNARKNRSTVQARSLWWSNLSITRHLNVFASTNRKLRGAWYTERTCIIHNRVYTITRHLLDVYLRSKIKGKMFYLEVFIILQYIYKK